MHVHTSMYVRGFSNALFDSMKRVTLVFRLYISII